MRLQENQVFANRYLLQRKIGIGGFSEVWKAADQYIPGTVVALKVYATERGLDRESIELFSGEYMLTKSLRNTHLVEVIYYDIFQESPYLVMPFYGKGSLAQALVVNGPLQEAEVARLIVEVSDALGYLHTQNPTVLHRDIKPDNILIADDNSYLLSDFGISRRVRHTIAKNTGKGSEDSMSIAYSAPERFDRNPQTTAASDIFSLGVMLYQVCTGYLPWDEIGGMALLRGAQIPEIPATYSRKLNQIITKCMDVDPSGRPTAHQLKSWATGFMTEGYWKVDAVQPKRNAKKYLVPTLILSLVLVCALALFVYHKSQEPEIVQEESKPAEIVQDGNKTEVPPSATSNNGTDANSEPAVPAEEVSKPEDKLTDKKGGTGNKPVEEQNVTDSQKQSETAVVRKEKPAAIPQVPKDNSQIGADEAKKREELLQQKMKEREELKKQLEQEISEEKKEASGF